MQLVVHDTQGPVFSCELRCSIEFGRQRQGEPEPYTLVPSTTPGVERLVIARQQELNCSRQHLSIEPLASGAVRVLNRSQIPLPLDQGPPVQPGGTIDLSPPFSLLLPPRTISVVSSDTVDEHGVKGLDVKTLGPGNLSDLSRRLRPLPLLGPAQLDALAGWLQTTMTVLQSAVGSSDFLRHAASALVQIVGLHSGRVLVINGDAWSVAAEHGTTPADLWLPSRHVLDRVREEKGTFWQHPSHAASADSASLAGLQTVVAAPVLDKDGNVIGALYGERRKDGTVSSGGGKLEAILVELLACGVAAGLARREQEQAALASRIQFEQFFTPELARQLELQPDLLKGAEREVTLLFCDVRGFSRISEKLGAEMTVAWMNDVMATLSECVLAEDGVLVDYIGDELVAMWGAPRDQPDQAERAARAALAMVSRSPEIDGRWREVVNEPIGFGIGLNTGRAHVGNTGSRFKFKYGPLGDAVNVASRVQGLTKYLRCPLLATKATRDRLGDGFLSRRVVRARLVNIQGARDLYELAAGGSPELAEFFRASEAALDALEGRDFPVAAQRAGALALQRRGDGPLLLVLSRAAQYLMDGADDFDAIWEPPGK